MMNTGLYPEIWNKSIDVLKPSIGREKWSVDRDGDLVYF